MRSNRIHLALVLSFITLNLVKSDSSVEELQEKQIENKSASFDDNSFENLIQKPGSIKLKSILEHQNELVKECRKLEANKLDKTRYDEINAQIIRLPAVCLFLLQTLDITDGEKPTKLEFVNWIVLDDEQMEESNGTQAKTKRDVEIRDDDSGDVGETRSSVSSEEDEQDNLREKIDKLVADPRFHNAVEHNRNWIGRQLSPVILVPGLLGSRLQAKLNKTHRVNILCTKRSEKWQDMWLSVKNFIPLLVDCWLDNARLVLDDSSGFTKSPSGIQVRVPFFGSVESVRVIDPKSAGLSKYYSDIIDHYGQLGYTPDENLLAAPYDFRLAPQQLGEYFHKLKALIETAQVKTKGNVPVTLVCHSMGCTHLYIFLKDQSSHWRKTRIRKLIALSSPWGGSFKALKALIVGDQLELPLVSEIKMRKLARTFPSLAFLLPQSGIFGDDITFVETPERIYKAHEMGNLLRDINLTRQFEWFQKTSNLLDNLEPLDDIQTDCIHSLNTPTMRALVFKRQNDFPNGPFEILYGQGDGTVNEKSLMVCAEWASKLPGLIKHRVIMNTSHVGVLSHKRTFQFLTDDVMLSDNLF